MKKIFLAWLWNIHVLQMDLQDICTCADRYEHMEDDLKQQLAHYEANHSGYDEYRFKLDEISWVGYW